MDIENILTGGTEFPLSAEEAILEARQEGMEAERGRITRPALGEAGTFGEQPSRRRQRTGSVVGQEVEILPSGTMVMMGAPPRGNEGEVVSTRAFPVPPAAQARKRYAVLTQEQVDAILGHHPNDLCGNIRRDALRAIASALRVLPGFQASEIRERLDSAMKKRRSREALREIPEKLLMSIAMYAETKVKSIAYREIKKQYTEAKRCRHALTGRRKRTREEKEYTFFKKFKVKRKDAIKNKKVRAAYARAEEE